MTEEEGRPPHKWVAEKIGFSIAGVSLLRSGLRKPSLSTVRVIEDKFGWPVIDQLNTIWSGEPTAYADEFERRITEAHTKEETK